MVKFLNAADKEIRLRLVVAIVVLLPLLRSFRSCFFLTILAWMWVFMFFATIVVVLLFLLRRLLFLLLLLLLLL